MATACAMSVMDAGSFSGGEFFQRSKGLSSSHGLSVFLGIAMAAVVGRRLGDIHSLGRAFSDTVHASISICEQPLDKRDERIEVSSRGKCQSSFGVAPMVRLNMT